MEKNDIYELWNRFEQSAASELELDFQGLHLHLRKGSTEHIASVTTASAESPIPEVQAEEPASSIIEIRSPLVGTFYRAPGPDLSPFITEGSTVKKGDVIGIVEAMKLMNEVTASEDGTVVEILAVDGALVAYDDVLVRLRSEGPTC